MARRLSGERCARALPGVIGTLMAQEALKLVLGWDSALRNRLLLWDAKRGEWQSVALKRDPESWFVGRVSSQSHRLVTRPQ